MIQEPAQLQRKLTSELERDSAQAKQARTETHRTEPAWMASRLASGSQRLGQRHASYNNVN
jgi:hypothetical protein